jgi:hypothetical protein
VLVTQAWLVLSGNFAWLNVLTMILAFSAIGDPVAHAVIPLIPAQTTTHPPEVWFIIIVLVVTILFIWLSWWPLRNLFARRQLMNASFNRWHLCNAYGAFGSVTKERYEVIIEATDAPQPTDDAQWLAYEFKGKPGDPSRMSRQFAPYHLRLDWLMWFLALGMRTESWFRVLLLRLLEADPATLRMMRSSPCGTERPRWIRARVFRYRFSSRAQLRNDHVWWVREEVGTLVPPVALESTKIE